MSETLENLYSETRQFPPPESSRPNANVTGRRHTRRPPPTGSASGRSRPSG